MLHVFGYMLCKKPCDPELPPEMYMYEQASKFFRKNHYTSMFAFFAGYEILDTNLFPFSVFDSEVKRLLQPIKHWQWTTKSVLPVAKEFCDFIEDIFVPPASSAGFERVSSSFGLVQTKPTNRLMSQKVAKPVKIYSTDGLR